VTSWVGQPDPPRIFPFFPLHSPLPRSSRCAHPNPFPLGVPKNPPGRQCLFFFDFCSTPRFFFGVLQFPFSSPLRLSLFLCIFALSPRGKLRGRGPLALYVLDPPVGKFFSFLEPGEAASPARFPTLSVQAKSSRPFFFYSLFPPGGHPWPLLFSWYLSPKNSLGKSEPPFIFAMAFFPHLCLGFPTPLSCQMEGPSFVFLSWRTSFPPTPRL